MKTSFHFNWKSLPIWTRFSIIFSDKFAEKDLMYIIFRAISLMQTLMGILNLDKSRMFEHKTFFESFFKFLRQSSCLLGLGFYSNSPLALLIILTVYFLSKALMMVATLCSLTDEKIVKSKLLKFFALIVNSHAEMLHYPINLCLMETYNQVINNKIAVFEDQKKIVLGTIIILFCLNNLITFHNITQCYSRICLKTVICRKSCLHLLGIAILKLFLTFLQYPLIFVHIQAKTFEIVGILLCLVISLGVLFYTTTALPEYNKSFLKMHIVFNSIVVGISFSQLTENIFEVNGELTYIITLLVLPFWIKLNFNRLEALKEYIVHNPYKLTNISYSAHLETIFNEFERKIAIQPFLNKFVPAQTSKLYIKESLERFLNLRPNNILVSLTYAQLIFHHFSLISKSYYLCERTSLQNLNTPNRISIFHLKCRIEEALQKKVNKYSAADSSTHYLWGQIRAEDKFEDLQLNIARYIELSVCFWKKFKDCKTNIIPLIKQAKLVKEQRSLIDSKWRRYEYDFSQYLPLGYLLYGVFKTRFMNMPWEGAKCINKYDSLIKHKSSRRFVKEFDTSEEAGTIIASAGKEILGNILNCSGSISNIFRTDRKSLLGNNINLLMPKFFQEIHKTILDNYHETGELASLRPKRVYGKDANNNIFPLLITVSMSPNLEKGIAYVGLITKIKGKKEYILFNDKGLIEEISYGIERMLNIKAYAKTKITDICSNFSFDLLNTSHDIQKNQFKILAFNQNCNSRGKNSFLFKTEFETCSYFDKILYIMILSFDEKSYKRGPIEETLVTAAQERSPSTYLKTNFNYTTTESKEFFESTTQNKTTKDTQHFETKGFVKTPNSYSDEKGKHSSISTISKSRMVDSYQETLLRNTSDKVNNLIKVTFILLIVICLAITRMEYSILKDSSQNISFALNSIKMTYERLTSLGWAWLYCAAYTTRIDKLAPTNNAELDRYKLLIRTNQQMMKIANDELLKVVGRGTKEQQEQFFIKDIKFFYQNETLNLQEEVFNSFEAINILVDKLIKFDIMPHKKIFEEGCPELEFVRKNSMNDLLISSEKIVGIVEVFFSSAISQNRNAINYMFFANVALNCFGIFLDALIYYFYFQRDIRVVRALETIDAHYINKTISQLTSFQKLIKIEAPFLARDLLKLYSKQPIHNLENSKSKRKSVYIKGTYMIRLRESLFIILLIICFSCVPLIGLLSSQVSLDTILKTKDRIIIAYKARNNCNLALGSIVDIIQSRNTSTVRNQPIDVQLLANIRNVFSNEIIFDVFTEDDGEFLDSSIETLFLGRPCSLVANYPGSMNPTNCPKATHNQTIGIFAVNSYYRDELFSLATEMLGNLTYEKSQNLMPVVSGVTAPKATTIAGAYMYLIDLMSQKFNAEISDLIEEGQAKLIIEIIILNIIGIMIMWILVKKILEEPGVRSVLQLIPHEEISKNKILRIVIKRLLNQRIEFLHNDI